MKTNVAMRELLQKYDKFEEVDFSLDPKLLALLDSPVEEHNGAFLFSQLRPTVQDPLSRFGDLTGYECTVNHIHLEDFVDSLDLESRERLLQIGVASVHHLVEKLSLAHPHIQFRVIMSCNLDDPPGCVLRFHKIRVDENWVKLDDLDGYEMEAILVTDVPNS